MPENPERGTQVRDGTAFMNGHLGLPVSGNGATPIAPPPVNLLPEPHRARPRPVVRGRSLYLGDTKLYIRGVTYGTFADGGYPPPITVARDFAMMAENGINALRTYTPPPRWLLDLAHDNGLFVMVGLPWEQHVAFLTRGRSRSIVERVREGVRACAGHPAVLCYAVGNEIPASIVRWYGRRRIEPFIRRLCEAVKAEDPGALVTYVNYPSTEYLDLPFLDFCCFNVFLESPREYESYLARLQNIAGDRPLMLTELGLDSRRNGLEEQAQVVEWKVREAFASGAAGAFVFSWTDEWHRGGSEIEDWDFGLVDRQRQPKPALTAARRAFEDAPFRPDPRWPKVSVVVCAYNAESTIEECLAGVEDLDYPDFETIVVDDGSSDATAELAARFDVRLIRTPNEGLSAARNIGLEVAEGEIVAYLDSDAFPDPDWLKYLATAFVRGDHAGVGGPNIIPPEDSWLAQCVSASPGGPIHVLVSDREAEHIPGCNMAFRKSALEEVGGFDPRFRAAGDDVDACWQVLARGGTLGYSPGAVVWHHRRASIRGYMKQQFHYGKAEALLERKWPERYNDAGHLTWAGRVYGNGRKFGRRWRVYYGIQGGGLFQSLRERPPHAMRTLPVLPEWFLVIGALSVLSSLAIVWGRLLPALALLAVAVAAPLVDAAANAKRVNDARTGTSRWERMRVGGVLTVLNLLQPLARLGGRMRHGLSPWRRRGLGKFKLALPRTQTVWSETWRMPEEWLQRLEIAVRRHGCPVSHGGPYDRWDLEVRGSVFGALRMRMAVEEHGQGKQSLLCRFWPRFGAVALLPPAVLGPLAVMAGLDGAWVACAALALGALVTLGLAERAAGVAAATLLDALAGLAVEEPAEATFEELEEPLPELAERRPDPKRSHLPAAVAAQLAGSHHLSDYDDGEQPA
jgi:GT2 family glycosyltransferase